MPFYFIQGEYDEKKDEIALKHELLAGTEDFDTVVDAGHVGIVMPDNIDTFETERIETTIFRLRDEAREREYFKNLTPPVPSEDVILDLTGARANINPGNASIRVTYRQPQWAIQDTYNEIRVTMTGPVGPAADSILVNGMCCGRPANPTIAQFLTVPQNLLVSGSSGPFNIPADTEVVTDWLTLSTPLNTALHDFMFSWYASTNSNISRDTTFNSYRGFRSLGSDRTCQQLSTGFSTYSAFSFLISKVEGR